MKVISIQVAASVLLFYSFAVAQTEVPTFNTGNLKLEDTIFQVGQFTELGTGCNPCTDAGAFTPLVAPLEVVCPAKAGETCTFAVHIDAAMRADSGSESVFEYVGDSQTTVIQNVPQIPPNTGFYMWTLNGTNSEVFSASHTFAALVKNTKDFQKHHVEIDLGCFASGGQSGGSCFVQALGLFEQSPHFRSPVTVTTQVFRERQEDEVVANTKVGPSRSPLVNQTTNRTAASPKGCDRCLCCWRPSNDVAFVCDHAPSLWTLAIAYP